MHAYVWLSATCQTGPVHLVPNWPCTLCLQTMFVCNWTPEHGWDKGTFQPYGPLSVLPSAQVLNYGQAIFEGMKAQESAKGRVVIFRPDKNAERFHNGALRMSMPPVPEDKYVEAVKELVRANLDYVSAHAFFALPVSIMGMAAASAHTAWPGMRHATRPDLH